MLFKSGVAPQALYGATHTGLNRTLQRRLLALGAKALGYLGKSPRLAAANAIGHGFIKPAEVLLDTLQAYIKYMRTQNEDEKQQIGRAWTAISTKLAAVNGSWWGHAKCTISAIQAALQQAEWRGSHMAWISKQGKLHSIGHDDRC